MWNKIFLNTEKDSPFILFSQKLLNLRLDNLSFDLFDISHSLDTIKLNKLQQLFLKDLIAIFPDWKKIIAKKQHQTHHFTLDIHTLLVINYLKKSNDFLKLDNYNKLLLLYCGLMHDIEKNEGEVDHMHAEKSAAKARTMFKSNEFKHEFTEECCFLIENHQLIGRVAGNNLKSDEFFQNIDKNKLALLKIFTFADLKAVQRNQEFFVKNLNKFLNLKI